MWTLKDLKHAIVRREEDMALPVYAEQAILFAERAAGRTYEDFSRAAARTHLLTLKLVLDSKTIPHAMLARHPFLAAKAPTHKPPQPVPERPPAVHPEGFSALERAQGALKVGNPKQPPGNVDVEPVAETGRGRPRAFGL